MDETFQPSEKEHKESKRIIQIIREKRIIVYHFFCLNRILGPQKNSVSFDLIIIIINDNNFP